jgi:hypothetical protein
MCKWFVQLFTESFSFYHRNLITGNLSKSVECSANDGCMVSLNITDGVESWARACCVSYLCMNDQNSVGEIEMWNDNER